MNLEVERLKDRNLNLKIELIREREKAIRLKTKIACVLGIAALACSIAALAILYAEWPI